MYKRVFWIVITLPESFFPAKATKKGETVGRGRGNNSSGKWEEDQAILDKSPHLDNDLSTPGW